MKEKELIKKIAKLETINDQLIAEFSYLNKITKKLGFQEGIKTLKEAAKELLQEKGLSEEDIDPPLAC